MHHRHTLLLAFLLLTVATVAWGNEAVLIVADPPADGLVMARVDLTAAVRSSGPVDPAAIRATVGPHDTEIPVQLVPDADYDPRGRVAGMLVLRLPPAADQNVHGGRVRIRLANFTPAMAAAWDGTVALAGATVRHDAKLQGGFPSRITFADGKVFESLRWNDRLYHVQHGWFTPAADPEAKVERVAHGPLCTAVRVRGRYVQAGGKTPASGPRAVYDWIYLTGRPCVFVHAAIVQKEAFLWPEIHFLEMDYPREAFPRWAGGDPLQQGEFTASHKSFTLSRWGAVLDGPRTIGMMGCGQALLYDGGPGTYLQARGDEAWQGWGQTERSVAGWLWIGSDPQAVTAIPAAASQLPTSARVRLTLPAVEAQIAQARRELAAMPEAARKQAWWRIAAAEQLEAQGRFEEAGQAAAGRRPTDWTVLQAGDLGLIFQHTAAGVRVVGLHDIALQRQLLAPQVLPLFELTLRHVPTKTLLRLAADGGWTGCRIAAAGGAQAAEIRWQAPQDKRLSGLRVVAHVTPDPCGALSWRLKVDGLSAEWSVWEVRFPQLAVAELGPRTNVLFPRGPGEVQQGVWQRTFQYRATYPNGWTAMQFLAAYDGDGKTGLYVASQDPLASTKEIVVESRPADRSVVLAFEHPAANMGTGGNGFELSGEAVWRLFRGDWFDAAVIYRDWVRCHARWYPRLGREGRDDTPLWMRELCAWAQCGGGPADCAAQVKAFAKDMGVAVGFHWYSWHEIPFDNDYPHYFPTRPGFAESVRDLQASGVYVMPYINGRLWDTRDKGREDFQFTRVARPAATKDEQDKPYLESYGSKESDGSNVQLAAMCPTTELWQSTVRQIVLRLYDECGVKGVYIDQVAAAQPQRCFDRSHGHPLGGGHWWTEGYWAMLDGIRQRKPADRMLTTECNAEPYTQVFDGYLTWHWQFDGQVPAFPAVYGGAVQMFGRAYRGGPTKDLALRMKAAQQLVFGEQIGWLDPGVVNEKDNAAFLRQVVQLRHALRRYFYAGEMARPPRLTGAIPRVTADWQWSGHWPVTTDALLAGAWSLPAEKRLVLILANVSDQPVQAAVDFDATQYGLPAGPVSMLTVDAKGRSASLRMPPQFRRTVEAKPKQAWAWEIVAP